MKNKIEKENYFPLVLLLIGILVASAIWYFDEATFNFVFIWQEPFQFILTVLVVTLLPVGIYFIFSDKRKYRKNAKLFSISGFLPSILLILLLMVSNL